MLDLYESSRDVAYHVSAGDYIRPPVGMYFDKLVQVSGDLPPCNGPQQIDYSPALGIETVFPNASRFQVNSLNLQFNVMNDAIDVQSINYPTGIGSSATILVRVRPNTTFFVRPFSELGDNDKAAIVAYWSVKQGTETPSMKEQFIPTRQYDEVMNALKVQNKQLMENGDELLVRYYNWE